MRRNPWKAPRTPREQGRATVWAGLKFPLDDGRDVVFAKKDVVRLVRDATYGASIVFQVGVTKTWGREPSIQVVLLNASSWVQRWETFAKAAQKVARALAHAMAQETVLLELQTTGYYRVLTYQNSSYRAERREIAARAERRRRGR